MSPDTVSGATPQVVLDGLLVGESPRWHDGRLWVCHWGAAEVLAIGADGACERVLGAPSGIPLSVDWLPDGRLLVVAAEAGTFLVREPGGDLALHADLRPVARGRWNEIVVDGRGRVYVNASGFDMMAGEPFAPGAIALVAPDGTARKVAGDLAFPNGMAVTPDGATLIVAESHAGRLTAFDIRDDGGLGARRVWADLAGGAPDGICVDAEGAVWFADVPNRCCVRVAEGGEVLHRVEVDRGCFACMLGGADGTTLFITAARWRGPAAMFAPPPSGQVLAVPAPAAHAGWP